MIGDATIRVMGRARPRRAVRAKPMVEGLEARALLAAVTLGAPSDRIYDLMDSVPFEVQADRGATDFVIQERRQTGNNADPWTDVAMAQMTNFALRLAGKFEFRALATINGVQVRSPILRGFKVNFPSFDTITADAAVKTATDDAWAATKKYADDNKGAAVQVRGVDTYPDSKRHELGFWVQIDTSTGKYQFTNTVTGDDVGPAAGASIDLGARPADTIAGDGKSAVYTVASFHTHTPTTYRINVDAKGNIVGNRSVGPSDADAESDKSDDVTGIVYDYDAKADNKIPFGWPLNSAAHRYQSGNARRQKV